MTVAKKKKCRNIERRIASLENKLTKIKVNSAEEDDLLWRIRELEDKLEVLDHNALTTRRLFPG